MQCHIWKASKWCVSSRVVFRLQFFLNAFLCISNFSEEMEKFPLLHTATKLIFLFKKKFQQNCNLTFLRQFRFEFLPSKLKKKMNKKLEFASVCFTLHRKLLTFENSFSTRSDLQTKHHLEYQNCLSNFRSLRNVVRIWKILRHSKLENYKNS